MRTSSSNAIRAALQRPCTADFLHLFRSRFHKKSRPAGSNRLVKEIRVAPAAFALVMSLPDEGRITVPELVRMLLDAGDYAAVKELKKAALHRMGVILVS
jgi:hypothetical protein